MATVSAIAKKAKVSSATVSYALNGKGAISTSTKSKVLSIAREMGYKKNSLRENVSVNDSQVKSIAFVSCMDYNIWGDPYWGEILNGCINFSNCKDVAFQVACLDIESIRNGQIPRAISKESVDGLVVAGWPSSEVVEFLVNSSIPPVFLDTRDVINGYSNVRPDDFGGGLLAVRHLYELGHRKIAVIAGNGEFSCEKERLNACYVAFAELGIQFNEKFLIKEPEFIEANGYHGMEEILRRGLDVSAVVCHGDLLAKGAIAAANVHGIKVPSDLSIIGFDNQPWTATETVPITTIDASLEQLGKVAVSHLIEKITNPDLPAQRITIDAKLVVRQSTAALRK